LSTVKVDNWSSQITGTYIAAQQHTQNHHTMAKTEHYFTLFEPDGIYHVFNRSVDRKQLFRSHDNYQYFLSRIKKYLLPVLDVYAYCLMGNHFHLVIKIKTTDVFAAHNLSTDKQVHNFISSHFRKMFQSYAMAFNKQHDRIGTLFQTPFKRARVWNEYYVAQLIRYVHLNPQLHGICNFEEWAYSSWHALLNEENACWEKDHKRLF
jgi:REP element-mobilizing transposase RayT